MPDDSDSHDEHHRNAFDGYEPDVARLCKIRREEKMQKLIVVGMEALWLSV